MISPRRRVDKQATRHGTRLSPEDEFHLNHRYPSLPFTSPGTSVLTIGRLPLSLSTAAAPAAQSSTDIVDPHLFLLLNHRLHDDFPSPLRLQSAVYTRQGQITMEQYLYHTRRPATINREFFHAARASDFQTVQYFSAFTVKAGIR